MGCRNRCGFTACGCLGVVISIVFGAIVGVLFAFGFIPNIVTVAWIAFGLSVLTLIFLMVAALITASGRTCILAKVLCTNGICLLISTVASILIALAALAIVLTPAFISVITLVALGAFFVALMTLSLMAFIANIICESCGRWEA